ncbi:MAG TPA: glutathione S-transferase N-terminal domain-containing protein [Minicystis sp.]|nr:glutathione S-transferase N-terminal domain-containing protein [Minicystis sp.]
MNRSLDVATSFMSSVARLGAGIRAAHPARRRPEKPLELYEFEACPFCRKVREALTGLDLDAMIYPCARGSRYRDVVKERGGKLMFPFLVDPNTGRSMYESDDIIRYLAETYGGSVPLLLKLGPLTTLTSAGASAWRPGRGRAARPARAPDQPLELWSFEGSPFCRIAREALCELSIPYLLHNVGKKGAGREAFVAMTGRMMVPYLKDPNTGAAMFESADIVKYLASTYAS